MSFNIELLNSRRFLCTFLFQILVTRILIKNFIPQLIFQDVKRLVLSKNLIGDEGNLIGDVGCLKNRNKKIEIKKQVTSVFLLTSI